MELNPLILSYINNLNVSIRNRGNNMLCSIALEIDEKYTELLAFGFQKDSELLGIFNYYLARMIENGLVSKTRKKWLNDPRKEEELNKPNSQANVLSYFEVASLFIMLLGGILIGPTLILLENIVPHSRKQISRFPT